MHKMKSKKNKFQNACQVCRSQRFDKGTFSKIICRTCKRVAHRLCYAPNYSDQKQFICDECLTWSEDICCHFCHSNYGMLKNLGQNIWTHVFCALTSLKIKVISYNSLRFRLFTDVDGHKKPCYICKKKTMSAFKCWVSECETHMHVGCVLNQPQKQNYLIFGLLDKHSRLLMRQLKEQSEKFPSFKFLRPRHIKPVICGSHSNDPHFIFCTCNKSKYKEIESEVVKYIQCRKCKRWFHSICTAVVDPQRDEFECQGCQEQNLFEKGVHFCEIVEKMVEIQDSGTLDRGLIKVLDSCIFSMSQRIHEICMKAESVEEINKYFCCKALLNIFVGQTYEYEEIFYNNQKKILEILHLMTKGYESNHKQIDHKVKGQISELLKKQKESLELQEEVFETIQFYLERFECVQGKQVSSYRLKKQEFDTIQAQKIFDLLSKYRQNRMLNSPQDLENIIYQTKQTIDTLQKSKLAYQYYKTFRNENTIFDIFCFSNMDVNQYRAIMTKLVKIQKLSKDKMITENQFSQIMNFGSFQFESLNSQKKMQLQNFCQQKMKDFTILFNYQHHQVILTKAVEKIKSRLMSRQRCLIRKQLVGNLLFLAADSQECLSDYSQVYCMVQKNKLLRNIITPMKEQTKEVMDEIKNYLSNPNSYNDFTEQQREQINKFLSKSRFYLKIVNYQAKTQCIDCEKDQDDRNEIWVEEISTLGGLKYVQNLAFDAMVHWENSLISMRFALKKLSEVCQAQVNFSAEEKQAISNFAKKVIQYILQNEPCIQMPGALQPSILLDLVRLIRSFPFEQNFTELFEMQRVYKAWAEDFQKFEDIYHVLQKGDNLKNLINLIDQKYRTSKSIKMDLSVQLRKLKVIKIWAFISKRVLVDARGIKFNMNSIYELEYLMKQSRYPPNQLRLTIQKWSQQAQNIEQKLSFYKPKVEYVNQIQQMHDQLTIIQNKRQIGQAQQLVQWMRNSQVQFIYQIYDLQQQVKKFRETVPSDLKYWVDVQNSSVNIQKMRKFILQTRFSIDNIEDYVYLYRKMYELKCREFQDRINRKEFYRLLYHGGTASLKVIQKSPKLLSTYDLIDNAKNEILKPKPNPENLLPEDISLIKPDIEIDRVESKNVQGFYRNALILGQKLKILRQTRADWQKYVQLMAEITRQPVRLTKLGLQITDLRNKLEECITEMQKINQKGDYNNTKSDSLLQKYKWIGIRNQNMEHFQVLLVRFREIIHMSTFINRNDYERFSKMCQQFPQLSKSATIRQIRQTCFFKVSQSYLETRQILNELGQALIKQGGQIIKKTTNTQQILSKLNSITKKLTTDRKNQPSKVNEQLKEKDHQLTSEEQERDQFGRVIQQSHTRRQELQRNNESRL